MFKNVVAAALAWAFAMIPAMVPAAQIGLDLSIDQVATTTIGAPTASYVLTMPTHNVGDLLVAVLFQPEVAADKTLPTGWSLSTNATASSNPYTIYRVVDGSEGSALTIAATASGIGYGLIYRIGGADLASPGVESRGNGGSGTTPDPASMTQTWGATRTTLHIVGAVRSNVGSWSVVSYPTDYNLAQVNAVGYGAFAARILQAASVDADVFTISASDSWFCRNIVVKGQR